MAIDFSNATNQGISFGALSAVRNCGDLTFHFTVRQDTLAKGRVISLLNGDLNQEGWAVFLNYDASGDIALAMVVNYSLGDPIPGWKVWASSSGVLSATTRYAISITWDGSSAPVYYVGSASGVTMSLAHSSAQSKTTGTNNTWVLGGCGGDKSIDGKVQGVKVYTDILTTAEIANLNRANLLSLRRGDELASDIPALGAAGAVPFSGYSLASGNTLIDRRTGNAGTPSGTPAGYGNIWQTIGG